MARSYRLGPVRRAVNSIMTVMIRAGVGGSANYLLTTTGRHTGQQRTTPVTLVQNPAGRWLVSPYGTVGWVHNVRADPRITLERGRRSEPARAEEVTPEEAGPVLKQYLEQVGITAPYFDVRASDPVAEFVREAGQHPVFRIGSAPPTV